ncbi:glutamate--tRNA ligase [Ferruginibacter lapsinanis]|uniref:glutamate--tRNA ligase n=1 Tax=Ferruginibacter lapsinanis TaxID=563172 RepID=UPI001E5667EA|nr:glutamate--tRNA ligase [Ferruginibacter lapsinanis]UEG51205.1 glutamate--tRNA ligase [Ferruginibacter lapsinanis]
MSKVRVRFAPSPTGGLHLGGVRTVLFNYLFAKKHGGDFIVRIEDTDQTRFVPGAEEYIFNCLKWCGLVPDESPVHGGPYAPYRQSERKSLYKEYALQLVKDGHAYYAFDTPEELESMREKLKATGSSSLQYDHHIRMNMNNSLRLLPEETQELLDKNTPYVIRIKVNPNEFIPFTDMIRGEMEFDTNNVDDKVLLKADGMPTYHLAVVVDDYLMKITHAFRGEEWLPSAPVHILLWKYLFGLDDMPHWAHLPLILKPDGNGKLSKRDGDRLGFPVYAMDWKDVTTNEITKGFKEIGFLPEAFINLLAVLGWNDGTEQEIFSMEELIEKFSIERVHKGGAKFDFEKAKWFNHEWIKKLEVGSLLPEVKRILTEKGIIITDDNYLKEVIALIKDRCTLIPDFYTQASFFFEAPKSFDVDAVKPKWNEDKKKFFIEWQSRLSDIADWNTLAIEESFKQLAAEKNIKPGELQLPFRIMLVGGKFGPAVFQIAFLIGKAATISRIATASEIFG